MKIKKICWNCKVNFQIYNFYSVKKFQDKKIENFSQNVLLCVKDRPFTLPPGEFRPKQSLGQNFLSDQNYVVKIVDSFTDDSFKGEKVIEIGPGSGALTRVLYKRYPNMTGIELDHRSVSFLNNKLPGLKVINKNILEVDFLKLAAERGGTLNIIANLPYYIVSQILFSLADAHKVINKAVLTMQLEVAERIVALPSTKQYGIPSVVFQLYAKPKMNFTIPPNAFYPRPKVDSALVTFDFSKPNINLNKVDGMHLRRVLTVAFHQRRKMMRHSLKGLLLENEAVLRAEWQTARPEELRPEDWLELTAAVYGETDAGTPVGLDPHAAAEPFHKIWRCSLAT